MVQEKVIKEYFKKVLVTALKRKETITYIIYKKTKEGWENMYQFENKEQALETAKILYRKTCLKAD